MLSLSILLFYILMKTWIAKFIHSWYTGETAGLRLVEYNVNVIMFQINLFLFLNIEIYIRWFIVDYKTWSDFVN